MPDLLVKLYQLPPLQPALDRPAESGVRIVRPIVADRHHLIPWVAREFSAGWADEAGAAFATQPVKCFVALNKEGQHVGFACYDITFKGFFGPVGVHESWSGYGVGTALLMRALHAMHEDGHAYGIIGAASSVDYYIQTVGAIPVYDSDPGPYRDRLRSE